MSFSLEMGCKHVVEVETGKGGRVRCLGQQSGHAGRWLGGGRWSRGNEDATVGLLGLESADAGQVWKGNSGRGWDEKGKEMNETLRVPKPRGQQESDGSAAQCILLALCYLQTARCRVQNGGLGMELHKPGQPGG